MGKERKEEGGGEGKEDEGGEKEGLPPLEWRSGYAPAYKLTYLGPVRCFMTP